MYAWSAICSGVASNVRMPYSLQKYSTENWSSWLHWSAGLTVRRLGERGSLWDCECERARLRIRSEYSTSPSSHTFAIQINQLSTHVSFHFKLQLFSLASVFLPRKNISASLSFIWCNKFCSLSRANCDCKKQQPQKHGVLFSECVW